MSDWVLSKFKADELDKLKTTIFKEVTEKVAENFE
jgi:peptidyl-tRNA hydrolase